LDKKDVFVPPAQQLTKLQHGPSCENRPIRAAEAKSIDKLSEVTKFKIKKKDKWG